LNTATREFRRKQLDVEAAEIDGLINTAIETKSYDGLDDIQRRLDELAEEKELLDRHESARKSIASDPRYAAIAASGGDIADQPVKAKEVKRQLGREACPLAFTEESLKRVHEAMQNGQNIRIKAFDPADVSTKAFSTVDPLLPAELFPSIIGKIHEHRLLDRLPVTPMTAPQLTFLVHQSNTGGPPAITAEGATKPDVTLNFVANTITAQKIACTFGLSWETTMDFPQIMGYAQGEVMKQLIDAENSALLNGTSGIVGFTQTAGILTLAYTTGAYLDTFSQGIENLRTGSSLAEADIIVMHPGTFGAVKRQKDSQNRYLLQPDPQRDNINNIWGVPVLQTTAATAGTALLIDSTKFGFVALRNNIELFSGFTNDDFQRNINRWALEERLNVAIERPSSVLNITGLPVS
jgi:HK97 family phage major capsid protein